MYEVFYNLAAEPFRLSPDHRFCFEHESYTRAYAYMTYAFRRAEGFVMITGRPGTGKTTLIGDLLEGLARERVTVAQLVCTQLQADDLLRSVAYTFGIESTGQPKSELLLRLSERFNRWQKENRRALLVVDEAQDLALTAMEELRLLTNIQQGGEPLLQVFLLGQPELRDLVMSPDMEQVHQRIVAASHIEGLQEDETEAYVMHRLQSVQWRGDPAIDRAIFPLIHKFSEGIPRRINLICSRLFLLGSVEERHSIEVKDVEVVIRELQGEGLAAGTGFLPSEFLPPITNDWIKAPVQESTDDRETAARPEDGKTPVALDLNGQVAEKKKEEGSESEPAPNAGAAAVASDLGDIELGLNQTDADTCEADAAPHQDAVAVGNESAKEHDYVEVLSAADGESKPAMRRGPEHVEPALRADQINAVDRLGAVRRIAGMGIPIMLAVALAFLARDVVPPDAAKRLANTLGIENLAWVLSSGVGRHASAVANPIPLAEQGGGLGLSRGSLGRIVSGSTGNTSLAELQQGFSVQFTSDTDALDYDAWGVLDQVVAFLLEHPEVSALISYRPAQSLSNESGQKLAQLRVDTVEEYLIAAGVGANRIILANTAALGLETDNDKVDQTEGRFVEISIFAGALE
ncbi:MAG: AAA family ATPase [Halioglobus sp.]|nr:AAA family ATPase [Halioglobus sp.]